MVLNTNLVMNEALSPAESNGWSLEKAKSKVSLYTRDQDGINTPAVKVIAEFDCPAEFVYSQLINPELTFDNNKDRKAPETIEYFAPDSIDESAFNATEITVNLIQVVHSYVAMPIVSDGDFVCVEFYGSIDDRFIYTINSVEHDQVRPTRKYVRGQINYSGWIIDPIEDESCIVTFINACDPNASVPKMVARMGVDTSAKSVLKFRQICRKEYSKVPRSEQHTPEALKV